MLKPIDIFQVKKEIQSKKLMVEFKNNNILLIDKQSGEAACIASFNLPEWINTKEKLPEQKQEVLMLFKSGNMAVGWLDDIDEHITFWCAYTDDGFYTDCDNAPLYWMSLPQLPVDFYPKNKTI